MIISKNYMILFGWAEQKHSFAPHKTIGDIIMKGPGRHILILLLFISTVANAQNGRNLFIPPLKIPLSLSASFGELRSDHFHSGIDIKTQGVTGKEVVASDDGYIYLLLVSPVGFGRAVFIRHPTGYSTVYGHLDSYSPEIEAYVKAKQYENKSFAVTIYPPMERFRISRGEIIGFSGNSGSSSGPHLHYEVRKSDGEKPVNPLIFNFGIEDNLKPVIERLAIYTASAGTVINGRRGNLYLNISGSDGNYSLADDTRISINGLAGFGITSYDYMNNTANRFGINSLELQIDSITWFSYQINEFSFSETRYINAHIDYEAAQKNNIEIEKTFVLPNDKLSLYKNFMNNGLYEFNDNKSHAVKIIVKDGTNNTSVLSFTVRPEVPEATPASTGQDSSIRRMPFGKSNLFASEGIKISIPEGALYDTLNFRYSKSDGNRNLLSDIHHLNNRFTPLQKAIGLSIRPDSIPPGKSSKLLIIKLDDRMNQNAIGGTFSDGYVNSDVTSFGNFAVTIDTIPPAIEVNGLADGINISDRKEIRVKIRDNLSGIKAYTGVIDGKWALFEYDPKNELLVYKLDPERITQGSNHKLTLTVTDNCKNSTSISREFTW
jgi:hypothetical protein